MGEECTIGGGPEFSCCGDLECKKKGGGYSSGDEKLAGGMGVCVKPKAGDEDGDEDEEDDAKVQAKVYSAMKFQAYRKSNR